MIRLAGLFQESCQKFSDKRRRIKLKFQNFRKKFLQQGNVICSGGDRETIDQDFLDLSEEFYFFWWISANASIIDAFNHRLSRRIQIHDFFFSLLGFDYFFFIGLCVSKFGIISIKLHRKLAKWLCDNYDAVLLPKFETHNMVIKRKKRAFRKQGSRDNADLVLLPISSMADKQNQRIPLGPSPDLRRNLHQQDLLWTDSREARRQ